MYSLYLENKQFGSARWTRDYVELIRIENMETKMLALVRQ